jgi:hypothetical protein
MVGPNPIALSVLTQDTLGEQFSEIVFRAELVRYLSTHFV